VHLAAARDARHRSAEDGRVALRGEARRLPHAGATHQARRAALHAQRQGLDRAAAASGEGAEGAQAHRYLARRRNRGAARGRPLDKACKLGLEGLIGKLADSVYVSGRTKTWIKLKCRLEQDFVIVGTTAPGGSRTGFGALLLGVYDAPGGKLRYAGKVGTGFDEEWLATLTKRLAAIRRADSPLVNPPREKAVRWVKPQLVAQIAFAERTDDGILRQASF